MMPDAQPKILLVDDDRFYLDSSREFLERRGFSVEVAPTGDEAIAAVREHPDTYSVVVVDYQMRDLDGSSTTEAILALDPNVYVLILSGDSSRDAVLSTQRSGAHLFVDKAEGTEVFLRELSKLHQRYTEDCNVKLQGPLPHQDLITSVGFVGVSSALAKVAEKLIRLRDKKGPVLLIGESGTGKELAARALHGGQAGPFLAHNCGLFAIDPERTRSDLFGHERGAFTGANQYYAGIFERARGGVVFLDEISALPAEAQTSLLRVLEEKKAIPMGGKREVALDFRLVSAAKPELLRTLGKDVFQMDLFHRISENIIFIPSLAERPEDIAPLVVHFCEKWSIEHGQKKHFLANTIPVLQRYSWPGNIRELKNVVYSHLNATDKDRISASDLGPTFRQTVVPQRPTQPGLYERLNPLEKAIIIEQLKRSKSLREAAIHLRIDRSLLSRLLSKHRINYGQYLKEKPKGDSV